MPVSLLASMTETSALPPRKAGKPLNAARSTTPPGSPEFPRPALPRSGRRRAPDGCSIAETSSRSRGILPPLSMAGVSASMLASVPPEVNTTLRGFGADQGRDLRARILDEAPDGAAFAVDRGGIADEIERCPHRVARLPAQRRSCIPVEINPLSHTYFTTGRDVQRPYHAKSSHTCNWPPQSC